MSISQKQEIPTVSVIFFSKLTLSNSFSSSWTHFKAMGPGLTVVSVDPISKHIFRWTLNFTKNYGILAPTHLIYRWLQKAFFFYRPNATWSERNDLTLLSKNVCFLGWRWFYLTDKNFRGKQIRTGSTFLSQLRRITLVWVCCAPLGVRSNGDNLKGELFHWYVF